MSKYVRISLRSIVSSNFRDSEAIWLLSLKNFRFILETKYCLFEKHFFCSLILHLFPQTCFVTFNDELIAFFRIFYFIVSQKFNIIVLQTWKHYGLPIFIYRNSNYNYNFRRLQTLYKCFQISQQLLSYWKV